MLQSCLLLSWIQKSKMTLPLQLYRSLLKVKLWTYLQKFFPLIASLWRVRATESVTVGSSYSRVVSIMEALRLLLCFIFYILNFKVLEFIKVLLPEALSISSCLAWSFFFWRILYSCWIICMVFSSECVLVSSFDWLSSFLDW